MKKMIAIVASLLASSAAAQSQPLIFEGGQVWNGRGFSPREIAVAEGRIVDAHSVRDTARRISINGRYVTPPFANAHAHVTQATEQSSRGFIDAGVYHVWNPNTVTVRTQDRSFFGQPGRIRLKLSQGGITEPRGHPERLYVEILGPRVYGGRPREWFLGNAFHYGTTPAEIDAALARLQEQGADFVKIYLLHSENYLALRDDPAVYGGKGLNPVNVPYLVARAHARGLPVVAHVETAHDLRIAALAGVDVAAHLPAYHAVGAAEREPMRLTAEIAALVGRSGMSVVPTYSLANGGDRPSTTMSEDARATIRIQSENLRLLRAASVPILIGTDGFNQIWTEVEHLVNANGLPAAEVMASLFATSARLFPERRVGCLEVGCEADLLILGGDPTVDIRALRRIERRVMAGIELSAPQPPAQQ